MHCKVAHLQSCFFVAQSAAAVASAAAAAMGVVWAAAYRHVRPSQHLFCIASADFFLTMRRFMPPRKYGYSEIDLFRDTVLNSHL